MRRSRTDRTRQTDRTRHERSARAAAAEGPLLELDPALAASLSLGHPWIYRDHVRGSPSWEDGTWVEVRAGGFRAYALWDRHSPIALRVFSRRAAPDAAWFHARIAEALALRRPLIDAGTSAYRLLYGEGDGVPGVSIDVYAEYAVVVTYASSLERCLEPIVAALQRLLPLRGIVLRRRVRDESANERLRVLAGREPPPSIVISENGMRLLAELGVGQKTGLFLDHRDNRAYVRGIAGDRRVLNLFAYTGAFSVSAALGGARQVTSVDVAPAAVAAISENFRLNGLDPELHDGVTADVFEYLDPGRGGGEGFDLVINDPPSFAGSEARRYAALRAYTRLHALALARVVPGGLYAAASCTAQVSPEAFRQTLAEGAAKARVRLQIIRDVGHALDHPIFAGHAEGRYLKFVVGRVLPLV